MTRATHTPLRHYNAVVFTTYPTEETAWLCLAIWSIYRSDIYTYLSQFNVEITSNEEDIVVTSTILVVICILFYLILVLLSQLNIVYVTGEVIKKGIESHLWNHRKLPESIKPSSEGDALKGQNNSLDNFYIIEEDISHDELSKETIGNDSNDHGENLEYSSLRSKIQKLLGIQSKKSIHLIAVPTEHVLPMRSQVCKTFF